MNIYTVSFFGHRRIYDQLRLDGELDELIIRLLREHSYVEFLVCRDGDFDQLVSSAIRRCQREYGVKNSSHVWVMPYPTAFFLNNEKACYAYYDEIEICEESSVKHFKAAFQVRNRHMVDRSDLTVFLCGDKRRRCISDNAVCHTARKGTRKSLSRQGG